MIGRVIKHYLVEALIGEGGMGSVYKGRDLNLHRPVAIKILHSHLRGDPLFAQRFQNEARIQARLSHPHIAAVYDYDASVGAIIMEYLSGRALDEVIRQAGRPLSYEECVLILRPVLQAIDYAHSYRDAEAPGGIVHRDLKPSNILLYQTETQAIVKVLDFGIAKIVGGTRHLTSTGAKLGTLWYISPEQLISTRDVGPASDIYSLGVTLYHMAVGRVPFEAESDYHLMQQIATSSPRPPREVNPGISPAFEAVILQAMAKNPGDRFSSCREFWAALEEAGRGVAAVGAEGTALYERSFAGAEGGGRAGPPLSFPPAVSSPEALTPPAVSTPPFPGTPPPPAAPAFPGETLQYPHHPAMTPPRDHPFPSPGPFPPTESFSPVSSGGNALVRSQPAKSKLWFYAVTGGVVGIGIVAAIIVGILLGQKLFVSSSPPPHAEENISSKEKSSPPSGSSPAASSPETTDSSSPPPSSAETNPPAMMTAPPPPPAPSPPPQREERRESQQLTFYEGYCPTPSWVICAAAVSDREEARRRALKLYNEGYPAGYLWTPDYGSLSGRYYYLVFIGPYPIEKKAYVQSVLDGYQTRNSSAYAIKVDTHGPRETFR